MFLELPVLWPVPSVEFVHEDAAQALASKEVATMRELDLFARFNFELLVLVKRAIKNVHERDVRVESNDNMESTGVEGQSVGLVLLFMIDLKLEAISLTVRPDLDSLV